ncbi:acetylornithine transaminase [Verrucomicrobiales bacterium]|nr:acetylornithine transaminase [Verrucomicrobiales bacterium]MDC0275492.1 acetylornithine transaminase [Verrucomicrobiales bacterium]
MISQETAALSQEFVLGNYGRFPIAFTHGKGSRIWDENGREFLDFGMGIAVNTLGHAHPAMQKAIADQAGKLIHTSNLYHIREQAELAQFITETVIRQPGKVFFCNSGAEANDTLIKLARKFGNDAGNGRFEVITCTNSFHGRTLGGIAATGQDKVKAGFEPLLEGFTHIPLNDCEALKNAVGPRTSAILFEPLQGEGGINAVTPEFFKTAMELRDQHGLLLMMDEVQCGFGRTGDWNGYETALRDSGIDFQPDAVSWAKGIAGGFPMGAVWFNARCENVLGPGTHGSTFGGTPLGSVVALTVLKTIESEKLAENAERQCQRIKAVVANWNSPFVDEVRGFGLMLGFSMNDEAIAKTAAFSESSRAVCSLFMVDELTNAGLITVPAGANVVRWLPALNVTDAEVDEALSIFHTVLTNLK